MTDVLPAPGIRREELLRWAAVAEVASEHPLVEAILRAAREQGVRVARPESFQAIPGHGVEAGWQERKILLGTRRLMELRGVEFRGQEERLHHGLSAGPSVGGHLATIGSGKTN